LQGSSKSVILEVAKSACGGESRNKDILLDTPSTLLRTVSLSNGLSNGLSNHGS
jgi:hypothetical protein